MGIGAELVNGLTVGLETFPGDDEDPFHWGIVLSLFLFRFVFYKMK